jgi:hypothetical protein
MFSSTGYLLIRTSTKIVSLFPSSSVPFSHKLNYENSGSVTGPQTRSSSFISPVATDDGQGPHYHSRVHFLPIYISQSSLALMRNHMLFWMVPNAYAVPVFNWLSTTPWRCMGEFLYRSTHSWPRCKLVRGRFTPRPLYSLRYSPRYPLDRRLGGPQGRSGWRGEEKVLDSTGTRNPTPRWSNQWMLSK